MTEPEKPTPPPPPPAEAGKPEPVVVWLDPAALAARWDAESSRLAVSTGGRDYADARAVRAFPASCPEEYVEFSDSEGKPIGMIRKMGELSPEARRAVEMALAWRYLTPQIQEVRELIENGPFLFRWRVATDRGERSFLTESPRESIKHQGADGLRITDLAGNNYEIRSRAELPAASQEILDNLL